jgi:hypothetical protein
MLVWCAILFLLGVAAFLDSLFNMGEIFRQVNSVLFMLISVALFFRTTSKIKSKRTENQDKRIFQLERQVNTLRRGREQLEEY